MTTEVATSAMMVCTITLSPDTVEVIIPRTGSDEASGNILDMRPGGRPNMNRGRNMMARVELVTGLTSTE